jgi:hypothetical protein
LAVENGLRRWGGGFEWAAIGAVIAAVGPRRAARRRRLMLQLELDSGILGQCTKKGRPNDRPPTNNGVNVTRTKSSPNSEAVQSGTQIVPPTQHNPSGHEYHCGGPVWRRRDANCQCSAADANAQPLGQRAPIRPVKVGQALVKAERHRFN